METIPDVSGQGRAHGTMSGTTAQLIQLIQTATAVPSGLCSLVEFRKFRKFRRTRKTSQEVITAGTIVVEIHILVLTRVRPLAHTGRMTQESGGTGLCLKTYINSGVSPEHGTHGVLVELTLRKSGAQ